MAGTKQAPLEAHRAHSAHQLLTLVASRLTDDFSGLGIVFYDSLAELPFLQLDVSGSENIELPVTGFDSVCDLLLRTARASSQWHDGFHFVHTGSLSLTHLSQFVAPPLPNEGDELPRASGARHMTALLASRVNGIVTVGLLTGERVVSIYESGELTFHKALECYPSA